MKRASKASWIASGVLALVTAVMMANVFWPRPITLSTNRTGDADLLARIGEPPGHRNLHVTLLDLDSADPIRRADIGATETTLFEAGSVTKALTGLALADSIQRGEVALADPVAKHLDFGDAPAGQVTLRELVTHHAGYPSLGGRTFWTGLPTVITAGNPYRADPAEVLAEARKVKLEDRGQYEYSNLGAAVVGQTVAAAAGLSFRDFLQQRIFTPLGMTSSQIAAEPLVAGGLTERGRASAPWVMDGYAPAGGTVTTGADLTKLAVAVLKRTAPGLDALQPLSEGSKADRKVGMFWQHSPSGPDGRMITWHNGRTGGYASFLGFDLAQRRAVIVLADVSQNVDALALRLLNQPG